MVGNFKWRKIKSQLLASIAEEMGSNMKIRKKKKRSKQNLEMRS